MTRNEATACLEPPGWRALAIPHQPRIFESLFWCVSTVLGSTAYLYLNLFASLNTPFLLGGDQLYFWMGAQELLNGQVLYRDFFQFATPGTDLIYAAFFKVLGTGVWVPNVVVLALGALSACVCFSLSCQLMSRMHAALTTVLYLVLIYGKALNATHHWFAALFVLIAVRVSMERITRMNAAISGALLSLATFFNQAHGGAALLGFVAFLFVWGARNNLAPIQIAKIIGVLTLIFVVVLLCLSAYYLETVGVERLWYCLVVAVSRHYIVAQDTPRTLGLPHAATLRAMPRLLSYLVIYLLLPVIYGVSLWQCWRSRKSTSFPWNQVTLLSLIGLSLLMEVAVDINWLRLFAVSMPGIVLAGWAIEGLQVSRRALFIATSIALTSVAVHQVVVKRAVWCARGELPGGRLATTPQAYEKLRALAAHTHRAEFFLQAGWPGDYIPLQVRNPLYLPTLTRFDDAQNIESAIQQMNTHEVEYVLWSHILDDGCEFASCKDRVSPFRTYLSSSYRRIHTFEDGDILWQKKDGIESRTKPADDAARPISNGSAVTVPSHRIRTHPS